MGVDFVEKRDIGGSRRDLITEDAEGWDGLDFAAAFEEEGEGGGGEEGEGGGFGGGGTLISEKEEDADVLSNSVSSGIHLNLNSKRTGTEGGHRTEVFRDDEELIKVRERGEGLVNFQCIVEPETEVEGIDVKWSHENSAAEDEVFGGEDGGV